MKYTRDNIDAGHTLLIICVMFIMSCVFINDSYAHHVLGRPSYSLGEDSNTPPSMQVETQIGEYYITYMVFPAFPKPKQPGRINLYASRIDNGKSFPGNVTFKVLMTVGFQRKQKSWVSSNRMTVFFGRDLFFRKRVPISCGLSLNQAVNLT